MRVSRAEDVDDAAAAGGCPRLVHDGADAVGHARPLLEGRLHAQLLVGADGLRLLAQQVRGQRLLHQPRHGGDDERSGVPGSVGRSIGRGASADEPVQRAEGGDALVDGPCLDGQALVGQELGLGELVDRGVVAAVGLELADEAASVVGMRRDDDDGACPAMPERGEDVGLGWLDGGRRQPTASRRDLLAQALEHGQRGKAVDEANEAQFPSDGPALCFARLGRSTPNKPDRSGRGHSSRWGGGVPPLPVWRSRLGGEGLRMGSGGVVQSGRDVRQGRGAPLSSRVGH